MVHTQGSLPPARETQEPLMVHDQCGLALADVTVWGSVPADERDPFDSLSPCFLSLL